MQNNAWTLIIIVICRLKWCKLCIPFRITSRIVYSLSLASTALAEHRLLFVLFLLCHFLRSLVPIAVYIVALFFGSLLDPCWLNRSLGALTLLSHGPTISRSLNSICFDIRARSIKYDELRGTIWTSYNLDYLWVSPGRPCNAKQCLNSYHCCNLQTEMMQALHSFPYYKQDSLFSLVGFNSTGRASSAVCPFSALSLFEVLGSHCSLHCRSVFWLPPRSLLAQSLSRCSYSLISRSND